jgi:GT2 family glycosyltransferase
MRRDPSPSSARRHVPFPAPRELSFVVPVRNDAVGVERCLKSIAIAAAGHSHEVIVVDNGSVDGSGTRARALGATVLRLDGRVAHLRNAAAKVAQGRWLAFVDADHEIDEDWANAVMELESDDSVGAAGNAYHPPTSANWIQRAYDLLRDHQPGVREAAWLGSGNLVVRAACFNAVGGFDEALETCEDVDLCQRLRRRGFRVLADSRLRSTHHGDPATLSRLFVSELWRGRDNLRVSLRAPALRDLPSVMIPILDLLAVVVGFAAIASLRLDGLAVALAAFGTVLGLSGLRAWRMATRSKGRSFRALLQACCVALFYDLARAFALVLRAPHRRATGPLTSE